MGALGRCEAILARFTVAATVTRQPAALDMIIGGACSVMAVLRHSSRLGICEGLSTIHRHNSSEHCVYGYLWAEALRDQVLRRVFVTSTLSHRSHVCSSVCIAVCVWQCVYKGVRCGTHILCFALVLLHEQAQHGRGICVQRVEIAMLDHRTVVEYGNLGDGRVGDVLDSVGDKNASLVAHVAEDTVRKDEVAHLWVDRGQAVVHKDDFSIGVYGASE